MRAWRGAVDCMGSPNCRQGTLPYHRSGCFQPSGHLAVSNHLAIWQSLTIRLFAETRAVPSFWLFYLLGVSGKWGLTASFCGIAFPALTGSGCLFCPSFPIIQRKGAVWSPWNGTFLGFFKNRQIFVLILPLFSCKIRMNTGISPISCLCAVILRIHAGLEILRCQLPFSVPRWYNRDRPHGFTNDRAVSRAVDRTVSRAIDHADHAVNRVIDRAIDCSVLPPFPWEPRKGQLSRSLRMNRNAFTRQQRAFAISMLKAVARRNFLE